MLTVDSRGSVRLSGVFRLQFKVWKGEKKPGILLSSVIKWLFLADTNERQC